MTSHIQFGISFVKPSPHGGAYVLARIAADRFAILEISAPDHISLCIESGERDVKKEIER